MWFDSHCHFDFATFDGQHQRLWQHCQQLGLRGLLIPGVTRQQGQELAQFCRQPLAAGCWYFALGLHPYFLAQHQQSDLDWLAAAVATELSVMPAQGGQLVAIGECGLDKALAKQAQGDSHWAQQLALFDAQITLAKQYQLPLILHVRQAHDEVASLLRKRGFGAGGMVHAFSGSVQQGKAYLDLGFKLGIGGAASFPRAQKLRRTLQALPLSAWLLESDAPDMKPAFWRGLEASVPAHAQAPKVVINSPQTIPLTAAIVAALHGVSLAELAVELEANLHQAFPRLAQTQRYG